MGSIRSSWRGGTGAEGRSVVGLIRKQQAGHESCFFHAYYFLFLVTDGWGIIPNMEDSIKNIASQFLYKPVVENEGKLKSTDSFVLCGMGGSHLAADILKVYDPTLDLEIQSGYGLPFLADSKYKKSLFIASSHSGNTEEVMDFAEKALDGKHNVAVITTGGKLLEFAQKNKLPYVQMPATGVQPRAALGYALLALAKLIGDNEAVLELQTLGQKLVPVELRENGESLANELHNKVPIIYSSRINGGIAYNWKIKFNETAKIPAFFNILPELNHNEMTGFDVNDLTKSLSSNFYFIFLADPNDQPKMMRRMEVLAKLYEDRGLPVKIIEMAGETVFQKIFYSLITADWAALSLSRFYGTEPEAVPMVEEFKKLIA